jgi:tetratricopeptide (TPR) repeat protein
LRTARIETLRYAGRYREAFDAASAALDAGPDEFSRRWEYVVTAVGASAYDAALERIAGWRSAAPDDVVALHATVKVLLAAGRHEEAVRLLTELEPPSLDFDFYRRLLMARCKTAAGKLEGALAELDALLGERALERGGNLELTRSALLNVCIKLNAPDVALERLERWRPAAVEAGLLEELGWLLQKRMVLSAANRIPECIAVLEQLAERLQAANQAGEELDHGLQNDLGYMLADRGEQLERATAMLRRAVAAQPRNPAFLDSLGWALYKAGDFSGAEQLIGRAVRLRRGQDAVLYDHLGDAQHRAGNTSAAEKSWRRSIELLEGDAERVAREENEGEQIGEPIPAALPAPVELLAQVRAKLAALERGAQPGLAPLAGRP